MPQLPRHPPARRTAAEARMPQLPRHPPPASLLPCLPGRVPASGSLSALGVCLGHLGFCSAEWGQQALPEAGLGQEERAQLVHVEGVGEPREPCFLFLKIQSSSSKQGWELPRSALVHRKRDG